MHPFTPVYIPVGVPTFHLESARDQFERSIRVLKSIDAGFVCRRRCSSPWTSSAPIWTPCSRI